MTVYNVGDIYLEDLNGGTSDQLHILANTGNIADGAVTNAKLAQSGGVLSEVIDAREGIDGFVYAGVGDAVRSQIESICSVTDNLFNIYALSADGITVGPNSASGTAVAFHNAFRDGVPLNVTFEENTRYTWSLTARNAGDVTTGNGLSIRFKYTDDSVTAYAIQNNKVTDTRISFTSDEGKTVSKLLMSYSTAPANTWEISDIQLEKGATATDFVPHFVTTDYTLRDEIGDLSRYVRSGATDHINPNNYQRHNISSVSDFGVNKTYALLNITSDMISGLPEYDTYATFIKINPLPTNAFAFAIYVVFTYTSIKSIYVCSLFRDSMTAWKNLLESRESKTFSIIGDSYSTFQDWLPSGNATYYPTASETVLAVSDTWWYKVAEGLGWSLLTNDSYSGSTVCTDVRPGSTEDTAFVNRIQNSMGSARVTSEKPNVIFMFGGTNDRSLGRTVGSVQYSGWTSTDLKQVLPAFCYMCDYLKTWNPGARIVNVVNTGLGDEITNGMATACSHYGITNVVLSDIEKANGHPTATGMTSIASQIMASL